MVVKKQRTVVTGPAGPSTPAPAMASRTNSSQALPKSSHKPNATPMANSNSPVKATSKKKEKKKTKPKTSASWMDTLLLILLSAFTLYAYNSCSSSDPISLSHTLENPLCRSLYRYKTYVVDPYLLPPLQNAYETVVSHPTVEKQLEQIAPYVERVKPHVDRAARTVGHHTQQTYTTVVRPTWNKFVVPVSGRAWNVASTQYQKSIHPLIQPYLRQVSQQFHPYTSQITSYSDSITSTASNIYAQAHPYGVRAAGYAEVAYHHGERCGSIVAEYSHRIYVILRPYLLKAYWWIKATGGVVYQRTKPLVVQAWGTYVDPHLRRIWEKVVELSGKRDANGNGVNGSARTPSSYGAKASTVIEETKASAAEETSTDEAAPASSAVSTTGSATLEPVETAASPEVPEEPVVPVASVTSSSSSSETQARTTEELASASSVIADRAPPVEIKSSLAEEIASSSSSVADSPSSPSPTAASSSTASIHATEELASASSVIAARHAPSDVESSLVKEISSTKSSVTASSAVPTQTQESDDLDAFLSDLGVKDDAKSQASNESGDDELDSFLSDLGLDDGAQQAVGQEQEQVQAPQQEEEESPEARALRIQEKRENLTGRHSTWESKVAKLMDESEKEVRDFLDAVRGIAAAVVAGKGPDSALVAVVDSKVDIKALTDIDGVRINKMLDALEKEGERLLSGVEGWVKRESTIDASKTSDEEKKKKLAKLEQLVNKVKDRFQEKVADMQQKVHQWFRSVKDIEANECLRLNREVKGLTDRAQSDIGMDYAWLEDVTYEDWQRYHDLMRAAEHFDKNIRYIQNPTQNEHPGALPAAFTGLVGTYKSNLETKRPPVNAEGEVQDMDPLLFALDSLGQELDLMVLGWDWRAKEIENKGKEAVQGPEPEPEVVAPETKVEEEEPVKILPISPPPVKEKLEGTAQVPFIGKSKEQVEQAFKVAGVGAEGEEL
ncbi:hypothetical protein AAF712_006925 [Marasmius tenuissimus]|uniref:Transcription factor hoxa13 n=1 Tax=Marasmius tenuissimus TaxID=585030 RepID=A0ABR2ZY59_9AGAR